MAAFRVSTRPLVKSKTPCNKFPECPFGDKCMFTHPTSEQTQDVIPVLKQEPVHIQSIVKTSLTPCKFGMGCTKGMACKFFHGEADDEGLTAEECMMLLKGIKLDEFGTGDCDEYCDDDCDDYCDDEDPFADFVQDPEAYTEEMALSGEIDVSA